MATHSSVLAWRIPETGEPGGLPSLGSHRVRHDWSDLAAAAAKCTTGACHVALQIKNLPAKARNIRDSGSIPGSGRTPGRGHGNPLQYSCLENPCGQRRLQATVHRVSQSQIRMKQLSAAQNCSKKKTGAWEQQSRERTVERTSKPNLERYLSLQFKRSKMNSS